MSARIAASSGLVLGIGMADKQRLTCLGAHDSLPDSRASLGGLAKEASYESAALRPTDWGVSRERSGPAPARAATAESLRGVFLFFVTRSVTPEKPLQKRFSLSH